MFRPFDFIKDNYIADIVSSTVIYHGFYIPGGPLLSGGTVDTSKAQFLIAKEVKDASGYTTSWKWAMTTSGNSTATYDQIWDNRASLNYY